MVDGVHRADKLGMGMQRIVKFFGFQYLLASQNDQLLIYGQTQDLIHGQKLAFAYGVTFPILWSPLGQLHFVVDLGIGAVGDCNLSGSVRNHTGRDIVGAAHEQGGVCIADDFYIASAATSTEEIGNPVHYGTRNKLAQYGISTAGKYAVQLRRDDYDKYDYLLGMDEWNIRNMLRILKQDPEKKVHRLLDFSDNPRDIADPWYTGNFDVTYQDIMEGLEAFLKTIGY